MEGRIFAESVIDGRDRGVSATANLQVEFDVELNPRLDFEVFWAMDAEEKIDSLGRE